MIFVLLGAVEDSLLPVGGALSILGGVVVVLIRQMWNRGSDEAAVASGWQTLLTAKEVENERLRSELVGLRGEIIELRAELREARRES